MQIRLIPKPLISFVILLIIINHPIDFSFDPDSPVEDLIVNDYNTYLPENVNDIIDKPGLVELPEPTESWPPFKSDNPYRRVIVELEGEPLGVLKGRMKTGNDENQFAEKAMSHYQKLMQDHSTFRLKLKTLDQETEVLWDYYNALNGMALIVHEGSVQPIRQLPGVKELHYDTFGQGALVDTVKTVSADKVWQMKNGTNASLNGEGVLVAVLDTGIDYNHDDLSGNIWSNPGEIPANSIDDDGNGLIDDIRGWDFVNNDNDPIDDNFHGTMVAGIIAANKVLKGVAPNATLVPYKVSNAKDSAFMGDMLAGLDRALDPDGVPATNDSVDIISISLSWFGTPYDVLSKAVDNAYDAGVLTVVAGGNRGPDLFTMRSPGTAYRALTVGATTKSDALAELSSRGPVGLGHVKPEVVAPGIDIFTTYLSNTFGYFTGTSAAAPHVTGAAALLKQQHPTWGPEELRNAIVNNADDLGEPVVAQGAGRLNVSASALAELRCSPDVIAFESELAGKIEVTDRETVTLNNTGTQQVDGSIAVECYYSADQELQELVTAEQVIDYIQPPSTSFSVSPNGTADIEFQLNIPAGAKEGYYWGTIEFLWAGDELRVPFGFQYLDIGSDMGEWVVSSDTIRQNERIKFTNLTVTNNARLELKDVTLFVSSHKDGLSEIIITDGALLVMDGCTVTNYNPSVYYNFSLFGRGAITHSRFSGMYGTYDSPFPGGINIYSEGTEVSNSTVFRCYTNGIFSDSAVNILLADNHIYQNGGEGILLWDSDNVRVLRNNVSMNWWDGIGFTSTSGVIADNDIHFNSYDGLWINHSSPYIANNHVTNSGYRENHDDSAGLKLQRRSAPVLENNTFSDNIYYGFYINGSSPEVWNTSIQGSRNDDIFITKYQQNSSEPFFINSTYNSLHWPLDDTSSRLTRQWFLDVSVKDDTGRVLAGTDVRLIDSSDVERASVSTGTTGAVPTIIATQYERTLSSTAYRTPYRLEINKSGIKNDSLTDIQLLASTSFNVILPLPDVGVKTVYREPATAYLNESINFSITLFNNASFDIANVNVKCILDGKPEPFAEFNIAKINALSEHNLSFKRSVLVHGMHVLKVTAALAEDLPERTYSNNVLNYSFMVLSRPEATGIEILQKYTYIHEPINFSATANISEGEISGYQFRFSDGTVTDWQENNTIQYFFSNKTFASVSFRARADTGSISNWSRTVWFEIIERPAGTGIAVVPDEGGDITSQFSFAPSTELEAVADVIVSYQWTFGDGTVSDQQMPSHKYLQDRTYNVTLTIKYTTDGALKMFYRDVSVINIPPKANFFVSKTMVSISEAVVFNAGATTDIDDDAATELTYLWDFGDASTATGVEVNHAYDHADTFQVILTVMDDDNAVSQFRMNITVKEDISDEDPDTESGIDKMTIAIILISVMIAILVALALVLAWIMRRKKTDEKADEIDEIEE